MASYIKSRSCLPVTLGKSMRQVDGVLWHISRMSITGEGGGEAVEGTPGLAPDPGRGALHPAACSHTAHGREKEHQVWVCNYEDWDGNIPRFLLLPTSPVSIHSYTLHRSHTRYQNQAAESLTHFMTKYLPCVLLCATMDICSDWIWLAHAWHIKQHIVR